MTIAVTEREGKPINDASVGAYYLRLQIVVCVEYAAPDNGDKIMACRRIY